MASITSSGSVSGLNVQSLVQQLVAAERAPYDSRLAKADTKLTTELSAIGKLKAAMSSFQAALGALKTPDGFAQRKTTSSDEDAFAASATTAAAPGVYDIEIRNLATSGKLTTPPSAGGPTTVVGTGTLQLSMGTKSFNVTIDDEHRTLAGIRDAINAATDNPGIRATLIRAQDGTRLMLSGTATGVANALQVTASGGDGGLASLTYAPPAASTMDVVAPADAVVMLGDYEVHSASNTVSDAIDGVSITLKDAEVGKVMSLTVSLDESAVQTKVQNFVSAYNVLAKQMKSLRSYDAETKVAGPLLGDAMLRGIEEQIRREISNVVPGASGNYTTLASIGITTNANNELVLDSAKFAAALARDGNAARQVFAGTGGVATRLDSLLSKQLAAGGGVATRDAGITAKRKDLDKQKEQIDARMEIVQARYQKQFNALDSLLTQMQSTSSYLSKQLASVPGSG